MTQKTTEYLHGYSESERQRLIQQSLFLKPWIHEKVDFSQSKNLIEIGVGVGAQLKILLSKFPALMATGVDRSESQLAAARENLAAELASRRCSLVFADGVALPFSEGTFDSGYLCWVLEHAPDRQSLLAEMVRVLASGAVVFATEVFLHTLFIRPHPPAVMRFWQLLSQFQEELKGDPNVGAELGAHLDRAGFSSVETWPVSIALDRRDRDAGKRKEFWDYWQNLLHSAVPSLKAAGRFDPALLAEVDRECARLRMDPEAVFFIVAMQARAIK